MITLAGMKVAHADIKTAELSWLHPDHTPRPNNWQCRLTDSYVRVSGFGKTAKAAVQAAIIRYEEETNGSRKNA